MYGDNADDAAGLHLEISADADSATQGLRDVGQGVDAAAGQIVEANAKITTAAERARQAIAVAAGSSARDSAEMARAFADNARLADQAIGATGTRAVSEAAQRAREVLADVKRQLEAIRTDVRAGVLSPQDALQASRGAQQAATAHPGGQYTRTQLSVSNLDGDPEMQARYRAYVESERQIRAIQDQMVRDQRVAVESQTKADKESADSATQSAKLRADALRDQVRLQQISLEEEGRLLQNARQQYSEYADARALIDKRIIDNQVRTNAEQQRTQGRGGGVAGNSLLNAGYVVPGPVGNAITNLGYAAQGGPGEFAVLGGAIAAFSTGGALYEAANVAAKDQEAMERLGVAVRTQGGDWKNLSSSVDAWADLQERTTTFGREETIPALTELATAGVKMSDAYKIVRVAEDASAATGKPLVDITHELLSAYNGNARGLIQLGVATRDQIRDGMSFSDVLGVIEKNMSGQATSVVGLSRHEQQLAHDFQDLARNAGDQLTPSLDKGTSALDKFVKSVDRPQSIDAFRKAIDALGTSLGFLEDKLSYDNTVGAWWTRITGGTAPSQTYDPETHLPIAVGPGTPSSTVPASPNINTAIAAAASRYGIDPAILRAVGDQESGLGRSPAFDPITGLSRSPGNAGHGVFQLDPASGASTDDLNRAAHDVGFAADRAAQMLATDLKAAHGDLTVALATYNAGGPNAKGLAYAQQVEGRMGPSATAALLANPASTNVQGRGQIGNAQATDLDKAYMQYQAELKAGFGGARQEYEATLQSIAADTTKSLQERTSAERAYNSLVKQDAAEQTKAERDRQKAIEATMHDEEARADLVRRRAGDTQQAYNAEIAALTKLRDQRQNANDPDSARDVDTLNAKIQQLVEASSHAWQKALDDAKNHYDRTSESLDAYLAKLEQLRRGASTDQKSEVIARESAGIEAAATALVSTWNDAIKEAIGKGASRSSVENLIGRAIKDVGQTSNYGDAGAAQTFQSAGATWTGQLDTDKLADANAAVKTLDQSYRELFTNVSDSSAAQSVKDRDELGLIADQIQDVEKLQQAYKNAGDTVKNDLQSRIDELYTQEHDLADQAVRDERDELKQREQQYQEFSDSATQHVADIFEQGKGGMRELGNVWKTTLTDMENQFAKSAFAGLFFGGKGAGDLSFGHAIETSLFGGLAPPGTPGLFGGDKTTASSDEMQKAYRKLANSPTGAANDPLTVSLNTPGLGVGPGGFGAGGGGILPGGDAALQAATSGAQLYGPMGALFGPTGAAELLGAFPIASPASSTDAIADYAGAAMGGGWFGLGGGGGTGGGSGAQSAWDLAMGGGTPEGGAPAGTASSGGGGILGSLGGLFGVGGGSGGGAGGVGGSIGQFLGGNLTGGAATAWGGIFQGFGLGETGNALFGGNQTYGTIGSGLGAGIGSIFGGPVGAEIGGGLGGVIGGLFGPHWGPPSNYPDRSDTQRYGQTLADLEGSAGTNGQNFYEDPTTKSDFSNGTALAGIEELLAGGQAAFAASTGIQNPKTYQQALQDFGASATGSGSLTFPSSNIGTLDITGAQSGGNTQFNYTTAAQLIQQIESGLSSTGAAALGPWNTYTIRRALPDYNLAVNGATATQEALAVGGPLSGGSGSGAPAGNYIGSALGQLIGILPGIRRTAPGVTGQPDDSAPVIGPVRAQPITINAQGATFVGADGISGLTDLVTQAIARKASGQLPNPYSPVLRRAPI